MSNVDALKGCPLSKDVLNERPVLKKVELWIWLREEKQIEDDYILAFLEQIKEIF